MPDLSVAFFGFGRYCSAILVTCLHWPQLTLVDLESARSVDPYYFLSFFISVYSLL
jgi:hypothetical protein